MNHDDAFLQSIIAEPDDDTPRLVFADWLDEHGQADRAEFIRLQCDLARMGEGDPRRAGLKDREQLLLKEHEQIWAGPVWPFARLWLFRRGFIDEVWTTARAFSTNAGRLFRSVPLRHLHLDRATGRTGDLTGCPEVRRLASLHLDSAGLTDRDVWVLARSDRLGGLSTLDFRHNDINSRGVEALSKSPHLTRLTRLELGSNPVGDAGVQALVASPYLRGLAALDLGGCGVGLNGVQALVSTQHPALLRTLSLRGNNLWAGEVVQLAGSPHVARLARLDLSDNHIGAVTRSGVRALLNSPHLRNLRHLDVRNNNIADDDREALRARFGDRVLC